MKKVTIKAFILASLLFTGSVSLYSCREEFTEEEALKAQQTLDLSVYAFDAHDNKGVSGATVTIISEGKEVKQTTNEGGVAIFPGVKIGAMVPVKIEAGDYATSQAEFNLITNSYRVGQLTGRVQMFSVKEGDGVTNLATIKGKAVVETDLTNKAPEYPAGKKVTAIRRVNDGNGSFTLISREAIIDEKGNYSLTVPTVQDGADYQLVFQNFEADQRIAKNGNMYDAGFPVVKPSIATIKTTFAPGATRPIPSVLPVYAVVPMPDNADATVKTHARASVTIDNEGKVSGININNAGSGYKPDTEYTIIIESLNGGSGAEVTVKSTANGEISTSTWLSPVTVVESGSGYPKNEVINKVSDEVNYWYSSALSRPVETKPGQINIENVTYGVGVAREGEELR